MEGEIAVLRNAGLLDEIAFDDQMLGVDYYEKKWVFLTIYQ